ncbi:MAG: DUF1015 domain-containing protein [Clostridia bacterium]|nr:DUF1015 domain-containing protein [Clostridia bacterium]
MSKFLPFNAFRPKKEYASKVAALPYDVYTSAEAAEAAKGNELSFLRVDRAEIDLPAGTDEHDDAVYEHAAAKLRAMISDGIYQRDAGDRYYVYAETMEGRTQTGLAGCAWVDDYLNNVIKKHEHTRHDKEVDRIRHVDTCDANTGPIFLTYRDNDVIKSVTDKYVTTREPEYDFIATGGVRQRVWPIDDERDTETIRAAFENEVDSLYIADGHHRAASAVRVAQMRREANPGYSGDEPFNFFLAVAFPCSELRILPYNRVIKDTNGMDEKELLSAISENFDVSFAGEAPVAPEKPHDFTMYLGGRWYLLSAKKGSFDENDPIGRLDVSILQNDLISPVLGITDPRRSKDIDFVGGIRGLDELVRRATSDMKLAFAMYPTSLEDLMAVADAGMVMPPKSTWFEPKIFSGLFIHPLS